jgi:hypothetical protein
MRYLDALGCGSRSRDPDYAARNRPANLRAIFHIKSDSAMFDSIAVLSGNGSADRVVAACGIGPFSSNCRPTRFGARLGETQQTICQAVNDLKKLCFLPYCKPPVNLSDASGLFEGAGRLFSPIWSYCRIRKSTVSRALSHQQICNEYVIDRRIFLNFAA